MYSLKCYIKLVKAYLQSRFVHRLSPIIHIFGLGLMYISSFLGVWVILHRFGSIGDWTVGQIVFIYSLAIISYGVRCLFFIPFTDISPLIIKGDFDRMLVRPLSPFVHIMGNRFDPGSFAHIGVGVILLIAFNKQFDIVWSFGNIIWLVLVILSSGLVQGSITIIISTFAFYIHDVGGLNDLYGNLRSFIWYPVTLYNKFIQFILFFIFPLAFVSYVPAGIFLSHPEYKSLPGWIWKLSLSISVFLFVIAYRFWKLGLKRYESTGN